MANTFENNTFSGTSKFTDTFYISTSAVIGEWPRANIAQNALAIVQAANLLEGRVHDASGTLLTTAGTDDLGITIGSFGTAIAVWDAGNLGSAGATTRYGRVRPGELVLPANYEAGQTVNIRVRAFMATAVADNSCTVDVNCYSDDGDNTVSADLCTTSATSMNSLTATDYDFAITATSLVAGQALDVRIAIACNDAATGTVTPTITAIKLLCDTRG